MSCLSSHSPKALLLDNDGLLVDTENRTLQALKDVAQADFDLDLSSVSLESILGKGSSEIVLELRRLLGQHAPVDELFEAADSQLKTELRAHGAPLMPFAIEFLDFAQANRLPIAVTTSADSEWCNLTLQDLTEHFDVIVTADDVAHSKPAPDLHLKAADLLGIHPEHTFALDDAHDGIVAANQAGAQSVLVSRFPSNATRRIAKFVKASLREAQSLIEELLP